MSLEPNSKISQWVKKIIIDPLKSLTKTKETEEIEDMSEDKSKSYRLFKVAKELNVSVATASEFLATKGFTIDQNDPNVKITYPMYDLLQKEYASDKKSKEKAALVKQAQKEAKTKTATKTNTLTGLDLFDDSSSAGNDTAVSLDELLNTSEKNKTTTPNLLDLENLSSIDIIKEPLLALDDLISTKENESAKSEKRSETIKTPISIADVLNQSPEIDLTGKIDNAADSKLSEKPSSRKDDRAVPEIEISETNPSLSEKLIEPKEQIKTVQDKVELFVETTEAIQKPLSDSPIKTDSVPIFNNKTVEVTEKMESLITEKETSSAEKSISTNKGSHIVESITSIDSKNQASPVVDKVDNVVQQPASVTPTESEKSSEVDKNVVSLKAEASKIIEESMTVSVANETGKISENTPQSTTNEKTTPENNAKAEPDLKENAKVNILQEDVSTLAQTKTTKSADIVAEKSDSNTKTSEEIVSDDDPSKKDSPFNIKVVGKIDLPEKTKKKKLISYQEEKELAERKKADALRLESVDEGTDNQLTEQTVKTDGNAPVTEKTVAEKADVKPDRSNSDAPAKHHPSKTNDQSNKDRERRDDKNIDKSKQDRTNKDKSHQVHQPPKDRKETKDNAVTEQIPNKAIPVQEQIEQTSITPASVVDAEVDESKVIRAKDHTPKLTGPKIIGKIELPDPKAAKSRTDKEKEDRLARKKQQDDRNKSGGSDAGSTGSESDAAKRKRKRKRKSVNAEANASPQTGGQNQGGGQAQVGNNNPQRGQGQGGNNRGGGQGGGNRTGGQQGGGQGQGGGNRTGGQQNSGQGQGGGNRTGGQQGGGQGQGGGGNRGGVNKPKQDIKQKDVKDKVKSTLFQIGKGSSRKRQTIRKDKRSLRANQRQMEEQERLAQSNVLEVTEFLTANELANLMDMSVNEVIAKCMELGMIVSINQRINSDLIQLIAEEFGFEVKFMSVEDSYVIDEDVEENEALLKPRAPIVTVMGHVDHGKTSLLDYVRKANVIAGEAGGITQHIGAYEVELEDGRKIAFLDTPGHEAFTAMRARGAQITDIAIIVIAADDQVMPQTREAINHAQAAGVPMIFAINKVDKDGAQPEKIKEQLAQMNLLVEDWGGKYQCQEISAKFGKGVNELLEKVLLEAEMLNLRSNPDKAARGTVIEAKLDKGRGVVTTVLVQNGTLKIGDVIIANSYYGRVKAMFDERMKKVKVAGPSTPVLLLGLDGVPQAGDKFQVMESDREARELANKRQQLLREQSIRMHKHITLEEIARRSKLGDFKELNIIVKGDVDGSVEALSDSLIKLSTEEVAVRIIMKGVGQISESDVLLASASNAIIIGFQVRPSPNARKVVQTEGVDVRIYSVIYNAINEIKDALEGLLRPTIEENIVGVAEVRDVFKVTKVGTIAGCMMIEGKINRNSQIRLVREGIVQFTGKISSLKRFKDDVREVAEGYECGISIDNFNDIKVGDHIEAFEQKEIRRKLE